MTFLFAKEFGWTPEQIRKQKYKDIRGIMLVMSAYNKVYNAEMENKFKQRKRK